MTKIIIYWPKSFDDELAKKIRNKRPEIMGSDGLMDCEVARELREMNTMPGPIDPRIIEGIAIDLLQDLWSVRLQELTRRTT